MSDDLGDLYKDIMDLAVKATGMTEKEIQQEWKDLPQVHDVIPISPSPQSLARRRMKDAGVPELFIRCLADNPPIRCDAFMAVVNWLNSQKCFLILAGGKGTRKTGSSTWALGQTDNGKFLTPRDVFRISFDDEYWKRLKRVPLLVLDDLGTERNDKEDTDHFRHSFYEITNHAYSEMTRMIITTNLTRVDFQNRYGDRLYDRLRESGDWLVIGGESVRGNAG